MLMNCTNVIPAPPIKDLCDDLLKIPVPEFYVFYDGNDTSFEQQTLKLSDAFETQSDKLELAVHVYNLADGMNDELKRKCLPIGEYSIFSNAYKHVI